ncbi:MAG: terminase small subunit [Bacteroidales bacterium]|nr:terminase small subunit [Bacteroidales bacterium]
MSFSLNISDFIRAIITMSKYKNHRAECFGGFFMLKKILSGSMHRACTHRFCIAGGWVLASSCAGGGEVPSRKARVCCFLLTRKECCRMATKMTAKQQRFCDEYLIGLNATQAAIRAGYSEKTARAMGAENLTKPYIKEYIDQRMAEKEAALIASQDEVLKYLTRVLRGESFSSVLARNEEGGEDVIEKQPDEKERLKAAELLGKRYGLYTEKIEADVDTELTITIKRV